MCGAGGAVRRGVFSLRPGAAAGGLRLCYDTRGGRADAHVYDGVAPDEKEWVMGAVEGGGHFTLALRGRALWAGWLAGCPGMAEPDLIVRTR